MVNRFLETITPQDSPVSPGTQNKPSGNRFLSTISEKASQPEVEGWGPYLGRKALQIPAGIAKRWTWFPDFVKAVGLGTAQSQINKHGFTDEEKKAYLEGAENLASYVPTQQMAEEAIEAETGLPFAPKDEIDKKLRLGAEAASFRPGGIGTKLLAGAVAPAVASRIEATGIPEEAADVAGLLVSGGVSLPSASKAKKASGLTTRRFESTSQPIKVTPGRKQAIVESVEKDFRPLADEMLNKNRTYSAMKDDSMFKEKVGDLFQRVEELAEEVPGKVHTQDVKGSLRENYNSRETKGISPDEYEKFLKKDIKEISDSIPYDQMSAPQLVEQYRKNNQSLKELFEPGKSSARNRAKRDSLIEYNRAIQNVIEKKFPETEFKELFEFTNKRWQEIRDVEFIETFMDDLFNAKIDYGKGKQIFRKDNQKYSKPFERILGKEGFNDFKGLMNDLMSSEKAMSYIKKAEEAGFKDFAKTSLAFLIHPKLAGAKLAGQYGKHLWQALLDKPKLMTTWKSGIDQLKGGHYQAAIDAFNELDKDLRSDQKKTSPK